MAVGTIIGALLGFAAFAVVGLLRYEAGDDLVIAIAWAAGAMAVPITLGRLVDGMLWIPQMWMYPRGPSQLPPPGQPQASRDASGAIDASEALAGAPADQATETESDEGET